MSTVFPTATYPEDTTGTAVSNKVIGEQQIVLPADYTQFNFVVPFFAPFFANGFTASIKLTDGTVRPLVLGQDFAFSHRFIDASLATAADVFGSITFLNTALQGIVTLSYQCVGGQWSVDSTTWTKIMSDKVHNPRVTSWDRVVNLPASFPSADHSHDTDDLTGMKEVNDSIQGIETAISQKSNDDLGAHLNDFSNPHKVTAQQTGAPTRAQAQQMATDAAAASLTGHLGAQDPHSQYLTAERARLLINTAVGAVRQPKNVTPAASATNVSQTTTLQASAYYTLYGLAQNGAQFQVSKKQDFSSDVVVDSGTLGAVTSYAIGTGALVANVAYFWRCRFRDSEGTWSDWSAPTAFSTGSIIVNQPVMTSPANGSTNVSTAPQLASSAFAVTGGSDTHASSDWEIWTGPAGTGTRVLNVAGSTSAKTSYQVAVGVLNPNITYYARVRHNATGAGASAWSNDAVFTTTGVVTKPSITSPANGDTNIMDGVTIKSSAFAVTGATDTQASADWEIWTGPNGTGTRVYASIGDAQNKTAITVPTGKLSVNTTYYTRVRHNGASLGASAWSSDVQFTTAAAFLPTVAGTPYQGGYYVGRMTQIDPATGQPATYALIVAPKSSGESVRQLTSNGVASNSDGLANTKAASNAGAAWAKSLTIGGYSDWYIPALLEWEMVYRNLKPTNDLNTGDYGANNISIPPTNNYTANDPAMTPNPLFSGGGTEQVSAAYGTSSTQGGSGQYTTLITMYQTNGGDWTDQPGAQWPQPSSQSFNVRAVRRVKISS